MANTNTKRVLEDGYRNAVIQLTGNLDTTAATFTVAAAVALTDFTNNDPERILNGFALRNVQYSISDALAIQLLWDATADRIILGLAGHDRIDYAPYNNLHPVVADAGYTGDIVMLVNNVVVAAGTPIQTYTLLLHFLKVYR